MLPPAVLVLIIFLVLALALFAIPAYLTRRAVFQVIKIFRAHGALDMEHAKTIDELGLGSPSFTERLMRPRNYKPLALQIMVRKGVVRSLEDGRIYMLEGKVDEALGKAE